MSRWAAAVGIAFAVAFSGLAGCSRKMPVPHSTGATNGGQLPFHRVLDGDGVFPTEAFAKEGLPAGSEISIRLRGLLSSATSRVGDSFDAVLDEPIMIAGKTVAPRGAAVTGGVLGTRASSGPDPGYLRVTLTSIVVDGNTLPVHASSIFAKGGLSERRMDAVLNTSKANRKESVPEELPGFENEGKATVARDVRFSTGHRFVFRLTQPLHP